MNKIQSGGLLIGIAVVLNIVGRLLMPAARTHPNMTSAGLLVVLMLASVVICLIGLIRLIGGLMARK